MGSSLGFGQEKQEFLPHIELTSEGFWGGEGRGGEGRGGEGRGGEGRGGEGRGGEGRGGEGRGGEGRGGEGREGVREVIAPQLVQHSSLCSHTQML